VLAATACGGSTKVSYRGSAVVDPPVAPEFSLRDQSGQLVKLSASRGRWAVVTFLYTHCPDVCPLIATQLNQALHRLGPLQLEVFAVSVDPRGDTPGAVKRFVAARRLLPQFHYLTGSAAELRRIWRAYHIAVDPDSNSTAVLHSQLEILIDPGGREKLFYDARLKAADLVHDLRLLQES
jgi:protein SCO1/2